MIAISLNDETRRLVTRVAAKLPAPSVRLFNADGVDGAAMEAAIRAGEVSAVLDLTPVDLITHPHPERLTAAGLRGIPQVISTGGLMAGDARLDALGKEIAEKACAARGPTRIVVPSDAPPVLVQSLRNWVYPPEVLVESEFAFDSEEFAGFCLSYLR